MTSGFALALPGLMALVDRVRQHAKVSEAGEVLWRTNAALGVSGKACAGGMHITPSCLSRQVHLTGLNMGDVWNMPRDWREVFFCNLGRAWGFEHLLASSTPHASQSEIDALRAEQAELRALVTALTDARRTA